MADNNADDYDDDYDDDDDDDVYRALLIHCMRAV